MRGPFPKVSARSRVGNLAGMSHSRGTRNKWFWVNRKPWRDQVENELAGTGKVLGTRILDDQLGTPACSIDTNGSGISGPRVRTGPEGRRKARLCAGTLAGIGSGRGGRRGAERLAVHRRGGAVWDNICCAIGEKVLHIEWEDRADDVVVASAGCSSVLSSRIFLCRLWSNGRAARVCARAVPSRSSLVPVYVVLGGTARFMPRLAHIAITGAMVFCDVSWMSLYLRQRDSCMST